MSFSAFWSAHWPLVVGYLFSCVFAGLDALLAFRLALRAAHGRQLDTNEAWELNEGFVGTLYLLALPLAVGLLLGIAALGWVTVWASVLALALLLLVGWLIRHQIVPELMALFIALTTAQAYLLIPLGPDHWGFARVGVIVLACGVATVSLMILSEVGNRAASSRHKTAPYTRAPDKTVPAG